MSKIRGNFTYEFKKGEDMTYDEDNDYMVDMIEENDGEYYDNQYTENAQDDEEDGDEDNHDIEDDDIGNNEDNDSNQYLSVADTDEEEEGAPDIMDVDEMINDNSNVSIDPGNDDHELNENEAQGADINNQDTGAYVVGEYLDERNTSHVIEIKSAGIAIPVAVDQLYTVQVLA